MVSKITKGDTVRFDGPIGRIPRGNYGTVAKVDGPILTVEWYGDATDGSVWRAEDKRVSLANVKRQPNIAKGDRVRYVTNLIGTPVPNGTLGTVKKSEAPFLVVEWDGKAPGGYKWHWSDKDVLVSHVKVLPKKTRKATSSPIQKRNSRTSRTSKSEKSR